MFGIYLMRNKPEIFDIAGEIAAKAAAKEA
jgi:hypothetical protein